ncbi:MAG: DNA adenine methylase [Clostridia bacterium]|nr:DNA adenine methylase [Clostridia bacterium]
MFDINNRRYTGSKHKLMNWIKELIEQNCEGNTFFDVFAGTGTVTESVLGEYDNFILNDFLYSNEAIYKGFFMQDDFDSEKLSRLQEKYNNISKFKLENNYVSDNFGGKYFSKNDAKMIGFIREDIEKKYNSNELNEKEYYVMLSSLLYSLDKISNTCGHYDAYIKKDVVDDKFNYEMISPIKLEKGKAVQICREDSNGLARKVKADISFIDPPYNSRQYSRFYHVLENITKWEKPELYGTALKPKEENMSEYCKTSAPKAFKDLIEHLDTKYIVVTYNNTYNSKSSSSKNKITLEQIENTLNSVGETKIFSKPYKFFNAGKTDFKDHKEYVFITKVKKDG